MPVDINRRKDNLKLKAGGGFVLLETIVAILLFTVGILGILGLQFSMVRAQTEASYRSEAAQLTQELIGLMWVGGLNINRFSTSESSPCSDSVCLGWLEKVKESLPESNAEVIINPPGITSGINFQIILNWKMPSGELRRYETNSTIAPSHRS